MLYALLVYDDEAAWDALAPAEQSRILDLYWALDGEMKEAGVLRAGEALHPIATAKSVRRDGGAPLVTDGPFAETKEQLGGYYLIEARDLNDALQVAQKIPSVRTGSIEVRPIQEFN